MGFEPTCPLRDKTLSRRPRYDHFGTSPGGGRRPRRAAGTHVAAAGAARTKHYNAGPYPFPSREVIADDTRVTRPAARISAGRGAQSHAEADARRVCSRNAAFNLYVLHQPEWRPGHPNADVEVVTVGAVERGEDLLGL